jgi:DNA invertase Pin-like site-specific DNA recombinase
MQQPASAVAYSYVRFSTPEQARGDSARRQDDAAADWCARNNVRLDTSLSLRDLGVSAFKGAHRTDDKRALAGFLKLVERGQVPHGAYLIIENLDRLSREEVVPATHLLTGILVKGVRVVQLSPAELVLTGKSDPFDIMRAVMELSRGHGESKIKSERVSKAWAERRRKVREEGELLTRRLPAWVEERGGKLSLIPSRAAAVRRVFELAAGGYGLTAVVRRLRAEKVPPIGTSGHWCRSYVGILIRDRRALGEFQPRKRRGGPYGEPIAGYFPAVVTEQEFYAARAGAAQRKQRPGRPLKGGVNVFAGLLHDALDGGGMYAKNSTDRRGTQRRTLINALYSQLRSTRRSFPLATFERGILSMLREVDPREVLGQGGPDEAAVLAGELGRVGAKIAELEAELLNGNVAALAKVLRRLEGEKQELEGKLAEARQKAAHPLGEAWKGVRSLLTALDDAPDPEDVRLRLRAVLRRVIDSIWVVVTGGRRGDRLAAAQVWFAGGGRHRDYLIMHRAVRNNGSVRREGGWWARSLAEVAGPDGLDLRDRQLAEELAAALDQIDLAALVE